MSQDPQNSARTVNDYERFRNALFYQYDPTGIIDVNQLEDYLENLHRGTTTRVEMYVQRPHTVGQYANHVGNWVSTMWSNGENNTAGQDADHPWGQMRPNTVRYVGHYVYDSLKNIQEVPSAGDSLPLPSFEDPTDWSQVSGATEPSECDPCAGAFVETWSSPWATDTTFNPQTGTLRSANQAYRYEVTYRRPGHLDEKIFTLDEVTNDASYNKPVDIQEVTTRQVMFKTEECSCRCCCCACEQEASVRNHPAPPCTGGYILSGIPFRAGQTCTGIRSWANDTICPVCVYPF